MDDDDDLNLDDEASDDYEARPMDPVLAVAVVVLVVTVILAVVGMLSGGGR